MDESITQSTTSVPSDENGLSVQRDSSDGFQIGSPPLSGEEGFYACTGLGFFYDPVIVTFISCVEYGESFPFIQGEEVVQSFQKTNGVLVR